MHAPVQRVDPASEVREGRWIPVGFAAALVGVPVALGVAFAQIGWFWDGLGWAGIAMVALVAVMAVAVIGALCRHVGAASMSSDIRRLNETVAKLALTAAIPQALAEAMWCARQRDQLLDKQGALDVAAWEETVRAFKDPQAEALDHWTPVAEELALWAQRNLPAHYTADDVEKPAAQTAPNEGDVPEARRLEYRSLFWRRQMMGRYVGAIAAKLETRADDLRQRIAEAGNPLA